MGFKTITIKEDVYDKVKKHKQDDESFSDLFDRTFDDTNDIMEFAGAWSDMSDEDFKQIKEDLRRYRQEFDEDVEQRREQLFG